MNEESKSRGARAFLPKMGHGPGERSRICIRGESARTTEPGHQTALPGGALAGSEQGHGVGKASLSSVLFLADPPAVGRGKSCTLQACDLTPSESSSSLLTLKPSSCTWERCLPAAGQEMVGDELVYSLPLAFLQRMGDGPFLGGGLGNLWT